MINNRSGIYVLINKLNGKIYIGQTKNFRKRMNQYKAHKYGPKHSMVVTKAIDKYGWDSFEVNILESFDYYDKEELIKLETKYITYFNANNKFIGYNTLVGKYKNSDYKKSNTNNLYKKKVSQETRNKLSEKYYSKQKSGNSRPVQKLDKYTKEIITTYSSIKEAKRSFNKDCGNSIRRACSNESYTSNGFYWQYV